MDDSSDTSSSNIELVRDNSVSSSATQDWQEWQQRQIRANNIWLHCRQPLPGESVKNRHGHWLWLCKYCKKKGSTSHSTTTARRHVRSKHPEVKLEEEAQGPVGTQTRQLLREIQQAANDQETEHFTESQREILRRVIDQKALNEALVSLITRRNLPHSIVQWPEFQAFCTILNPESNELLYQSHSSIPPLIAKAFESHRRRLKELLVETQSIIHFNIDVWSSPNKRSLLAITARFVHNNSLKKALLALPELGVSHRGEVVSDEFLEAVQFYNIVHKLGYITCDNASSNDTMVRSISQQARSHGFEWNERWRRIRCAGHVINLTVQAFLFANNKEAVKYALDRAKEQGVEVDESFIEKQDGASFCKIPPMNTLHKLVVAIRSSTRRYNEFLQLAGRTIPADNDTRWNSWYSMLQVACDLRASITTFCTNYDAEFQQYLLSGSDWSLLQQVRDFLHPFFMVTKSLEGDQVTFDKYLFRFLFLESHYREWTTKSEEGSILAKCIETSLFAFEKYSKLQAESPVYAAALLLHPTLRKAHLRDKWKTQGRRMESAVKAAEGLWIREYKDKIPQQQDSPIKGGLSALELYERQHLNKSQRGGGKSKDEFHTFIDQTSFNIDCTALQWWLEPSQVRSFPNLSKMAVDILSIDCMSAEAERVFSGGTRTVSWQRSALKGVTIEQTECLKHWITSGVTGGSIEP